MIHQKFGLYAHVPPQVKTVDTMILYTERNALMRKPPKDWQEEGIKPLDCAIWCYSPVMAKEQFLLRFMELKQARIGIRL